MSQYINRLNKNSKNSSSIMTPMVSVIVPNYNGEKILPLCLKSLLNQTYKNFEIIVVDNNSSDNSVKIINTFKRKTDISIKLLKLKRNLGYSGAITLAAKYARGKYILATNNDVIFDKHYLENILKILEYIRLKDPKVVAASGLHFYYPEQSIINYAGGGLSLVSGYYMYYQKDARQLTKEERKYLTSIRYVAFPTGAAALIDRTIFIRFGGYYPYYFAGIEEFDFGIVLYKFGYKVIYIPKAILYHIESVTFGKKRGIFVPHKLFIILRNLLIMYFRLYEAAYLIPAVFMHIGVSIALLLYSIFKNKKEIIYSIIKSYKLFLRYDLGHIRRTRAYYVSKNLSKACSLHSVIVKLKKYGAYLPIRKAIRRYISYIIHI